MTKFAIQVFLQNTLVEYIGVYSDTNYQIGKSFRKTSNHLEKPQLSIDINSKRCLPLRRGNIHSYTVVSCTFLTMKTGDKLFQLVIWLTSHGWIVF